MEEQTNNRRGLIIFAVIGLALVVLLVVGIFALRNRDQALVANERPQSSGQNQADRQPEQPPASPAPSPTEPDQAEQRRQQQEAAARQEAERQAAEDRQRAEAAAAANAEQRRQQAQTAVPSTGPATVPSTGPVTDLAVSAFGITLLAFGLLRWHKSRASLRHSPLI